MKWVSTVATAKHIDDSLRHACDVIESDLRADDIDLLCVFVSPHYSDQFELIPTYLRRRYPQARILGCSAGGVIGDGHEYENERSISITAASLPGVDISLLFTDTMNLPDDDAPPGAWHAELGLEASSEASFILIADPFTARIDTLLTGMDYAWPDAPKLGGLASGSGQMGEHVLFMDGTVYYQGCIIACLTGNIILDGIVAQGCRPIGEALPVTSHDENLLQSMGGQPPLDYLRALAATMSDADRELLQNALFIGIEKDRFDDDSAENDFLIRNIIGVETESGALVVGSDLNRGQMVQFHLRDQWTSAEDLNTLLTQYDARPKTSEPSEPPCCSPAWDGGGTCMGKPIMIPAR